MIGVDKFKKKLTVYLKKVESGESITITSHGHEIAQLVPPANKMKNARKSLEALRKHSFVGDVISPIENEWKMLK